MFSVLFVSALQCFCSFHVAGGHPHKYEAANSCQYKKIEFVVRYGVQGCVGLPIEVWDR